MRVLVTGGAGFIGSALARHLVLERGCAVLVVDKLTYAGDRRNLAACEGREGFSFLEADITDPAAMRGAMESFRPDAVAHLAAESHVDRSITGAAPFIHTNVTGTFVLLEAARAIGMHRRTLQRILRRHGGARTPDQGTQRIAGDCGDEYRKPPFLTASRS